MSIAYRHRRKERARQKRLSMRKLMVIAEGQHNALEYAASIINRGFWGRLKWALFKK